jgi:hypothetical protein
MISLPTFEFQIPNHPGPSHRQNHDLYDVERLAVQHVFEVLAVGYTDQLLAKTERVIQVQELQIQPASSRFFALVVDPGELDLRTWVELLVPEATLLSNGRLNKAPGDLTTGNLTYCCEPCQGRLGLLFRILNYL